MHIPDGFLTDPVCAATAAVAMAGVAGAAVLARKSQRSKPASSAAVVGAGIFAAQMINFPVADGTSGHLVGAALATAMLGPAAATLVMTTVLAVQCLVFGDGGVYALGANVLNMAVISVLVSEGVLLGCERLKLSRLFAIALAAWCAVLAAAFCCAIELVMSSAGSLGVVMPAMLKVHAVIGVGEAAITVGVIVAARVVGPLVHRRARIGLAAAAAVAALLSPWASTAADGLEKVAETCQFADRAIAALSAPVPDYSMPGIDGGVATAAAGVLGVLIVALLLGAAGWRRGERLLS